jgi:hypothetical protein
MCKICEIAIEYNAILDGLFDDSRVDEIMADDPRGELKRHGFVSKEKAKEIFLSYVLMKMSIFKAIDVEIDPMQYLHIVDQNLRLEMVRELLGITRGNHD